jgi:hypothetical protein
MWERIGRAEHRADLAVWGSKLREESKELSADLQTAIERTMLKESEPPCLPVVAGATEPFDVATAHDVHDPQFRAYRTNVEMLFSGCLTRPEVEASFSAQPRFSRQSLSRHRRTSMARPISAMDYLRNSRSRSTRHLRRPR